PTCSPFPYPTLFRSRLYLRGQGFAQSGLEGAGSIDVPDGKMYNLPPLLDLLKVLNLRVPDKTLFEEAHVQFGIRGQKVNVSELRDRKSTRLNSSHRT